MSALDLLLSAQRPFLNDGGIETELIFLDNLDLPEFAAFVLLFDRDGREAVARYYNRYLDLAEAEGRDFLLDTPTWRANSGWAPRLDLNEAQIRYANRIAVELARDLRAARPWADRILINGNIGPGGDGYAPDQLLTPDAAEALHAAQLETFAEEEVDLATALTITHAGEAIGLARRAQSLGLPLAIAFTVETDGHLPVGQSLPDAIAEVDDATGGSVLYFGINCAHPDHFIDRLSGDWTQRIGVVRANASTRSHAELDEATELDDGIPESFGPLYAALADRLPNLRVIGGCCGTDHRHVAAMARA